MIFLKNFVFLFFAYHYGIGQNLIPDSSFENNKFLPMEFSAVSASYTWSIPSWGTSDLFCKCEKKTKLLREKIYSEVDVPENTMGIQSSHSGKCYAGFFLFSHGNYREYLQTPLTVPLEKNKTYRFSFYISLADYSQASIDRLGVCFIDHKAHYQNSDVIRDLDPVYINIGRVGNDIKNWHLITITYRSHGGETHVLIGSFEINKIKKTKFKAPTEVKTRINQRTGRDTYYFIDDVSLVETDIKEEIELTDTDTIATEVILKDTALVYQHVYFKTNQTVLQSESSAELDALVLYLSKNKKSIEISGHTDNLGDEKSNKKLSNERAKAVAGYLNLHGVDKARIKCKSYGSSQPIATNTTEDGRQRNRRVEVIIKE